LLSETDRNTNLSTYAYDALDRLTGVTWVVPAPPPPAPPGPPPPSGPVPPVIAGSSVGSPFTYIYDAADNLLSAANKNGTVTMSYDALDHVTVTQEPFNVRLTASYDAADNRTLLQDSFGGVMTSSYD